MRLNAIVVAVVAGLTFVGTGGVASADTGEPATTDVRSSFLGGVPVSTTDALPALLGETLQLGWCHSGPEEASSSWYQSSVRPTSVITVGATDSTRLIRVTVDFEVASGVLIVTPSDFFLTDAEGARYQIVAGGGGSDTEASPAPITFEPLLPRNGVVARTFDVEVPLRTAGLLISYDPSPADVVIGEWTLSAP